MSEEIQPHEQRDSKFVCPTDQIFVRDYAIEILQDLMKQEKQTNFNYLFDISSEVTPYEETEFQVKFGERRLRALMIDRLFSVGSMPQLGLSDKS